MIEADTPTEGLDALMSAIAGHFRRREPRAHAKKYIQALMSDLPRKNCWTIAEHAGDAAPHTMQHLLHRAKWDTTAVMAAVRGFVCTRLDDGAAVAVLDESGQEKKGTATIGAKRQYVGCAGRVSNAINVVYCSYAAAAGHALVGARLYVPAEQAADAHRREQAHLPEDTEFATKPELGRQILADLHAEGRLPGRVTGDEVYGRDPHLRAWLESPQVSTGYVLGIAASTPIAFDKARTRRADSILSCLIAADWVTASCGPGSKGERNYAWAWAATTDTRRHLLIRRSLTADAKGVREVAFFLCFVPRGAPRRTGDADHRSRAALARGGGLPDRQGRLRAGPLPGAHLSGAAAPHRAGHGRLGGLLRGRRAGAPLRRPPTADQPGPESARRARADPPHRY